MTKLCEKCFNPLNWTGATVKHGQFTYEPCEVCEQQAEIVLLRAEVEAWRRSFPTQHVRPGATFCCTKLEEE